MSAFTVRGVSVEVEQSSAEARSNNTIWGQSHLLLCHQIAFDLTLIRRLEDRYPGTGYGRRHTATFLVAAPFPSGFF
jgi:hypothetical protein